MTHQRRFQIFKWLGLFLITVGSAILITLIQSLIDRGYASVSSFLYGIIFIIAGALIKGADK